MSKWPKFLVGERVFCPTDNNGPVHHGEVVEVLDERTVKVAFDDLDEPRFYHPNHLIPE